MSGRKPAGPAAAALALVWALTVAASGGVICDVGVIPNPFSPNGDGVFDETAVIYSLSEEATVEVSVADSVSGALQLLWSGGQEAGEGFQQWWDGQFGDSLVSDGEYWFLLHAVPLSGNPPQDTTVVFRADTEAPVVSALSVTPNRFSPDGDGVGDSLMISFEVGVAEPSDEVLVTVLDADEQPVRQVYSASGVASAVVFWDGADENGTIVADGLHAVRVESRDSAGNQSESEAMVDLDTTPPALGVNWTDPPAAMKVRFDSTADTVRGWATDGAGVVYVERSFDEETWEELEIEPSDFVEWSAVVVCDTCEADPDTVDVTTTMFVRAHDGTPTADGEGHVNGPSTSEPVASIDIIFDLARPQHTSSVVSGGDDVFEPGEVVAITTAWDDTDYTITANFSEVDTLFETEAVHVETLAGTGTRYKVTYELTQDGARVGVTAPVTIQASDLFGRPGDAVSVTITVGHETQDGPTDFGVNVNSFQPPLGEEVVVSLGSYDGTATVSVYNMAGTLVRTLESQGGSQISWYGENDEGESVASGVYFLRIQTNGNEAVRKVAVVR
jgi:flagellar hook assembly protein FlgD